MLFAPRAVGELPQYFDRLELTANDASFHSQVGFSVDIAGSVAIAGAPPINLAGSAYLFDVTTGGQTRKLSPSLSSSSDKFGASVATDGVTAIVGAHQLLTANSRFDPGIRGGAAFVFDVATGAQSRLLQPTGLADDDHFGYSVAVDGDYALIGAPRDPDNTQGRGAAYLFDLRTGAQVYKWQNDLGGQDDRFGWSVALEDGVAVVSAPYDTRSGQGEGSVFLYDTLSGQQLDRLHHPEPTTDDFFGWSVAISDGRVLVGSLNFEGSAFLFNIGDDAPVRELRWDSHNSPTPTRFGWDVDLDGALAVVGAPTDYAAVGAAVVFDADSGVILEVVREFVEGSPSTQLFGSSVAVDESVVIIGSPNEAPNGIAVLLYGSPVPEPSSAVLALTTVLGFATRRVAGVVRS